jgi:NADP-dependent 3-hydroxy acid dehydrogenase YdfG
MVPKSKSAITGAGWGIGAAICRRLTGDGLPVAAWDFNGQSIERLKADGAAGP